MRVIFVSFTDVNKTHEMYSKNNNITIMRGVETEDNTNELFDTFRKRYQEGLDTKMRGSSFTFERIDLLEYHLHKISLNRGSSYIKSPKWIKNKGVTINPKNTKDNNCFQYAIIAALNYHNINNHPERISKLKPLNNYNWKDIEFPAHSKDWKKFECNNKTIALNVLYLPYNAKQEINNDDDDENEYEYDGTKYIRIECLLQKISTCQNNHEKSYTEKKAVHKASGYSLITCYSFDKSETERKYYRGRDCMKMFCNDLKEQAMRIINYEQKPMIPLTNEEKESYENQQICHICEREFCTDKDNKEEF